MSKVTIDDNPWDSQAISKSFLLFKSRVQAFQKEMGELLKECRQLGRSYALIVAAQALRDKMRDILSQFHENAKHLSPHLGKPGKLEIRAHIKVFATKLEDVANAFENLRKCLDEFREYTAESAKIKDVISQFQTDLRYRAACLGAYEDKFDDDNLRHYIHEIAIEMGEDLDALTSDFKFFNDYGMPAIKYEQMRDAESVLNMSTVATFFSAVTATTLQMSIGIEPRTNILSIVNTFWFCSLVLSIGAALDSLLHVSWKRTTYGSRGQRLPIWISVWIHASAPVFLAVSIVCFIAGLALFTYASNQAGFTKVCTLITTGITSFGLLNVSCWVAYEQWIVPFLVSKRWDFLRIVSGKFEITHGPDNFHKADSISDISKVSLQSDLSSPNLHAPTLQSHLSPVTGVLRRLFSSVPQVMSSTLHRSRDPEVPRRIYQEPGEKAREDAVHRWNKSTAIAATVSSATKKLWEGTGIGHPRMEPPAPLMDDPMSTAPEKPAAADAHPPVSPHSLVFPDEPDHVLALIFGQVQDMEFSPNGQLLATTCFDTNTLWSTTIIYTMPKYYTFRCRHLGRKAMSRQVAWSSRNDRLLVRLDDSIDIINANGILLNIIRRSRRVESAAWYTPSEVLSVEGNTIFRLSVDGNVKAKYRFPHLLLRDIAVVPMRDLLLVIGRVMVSSDGIPPKKERAEKQIIVYNLATGEIKSRNPVLDDVRYITLTDNYSKARKGFDVLLSHKDKLPPRLWTLEPNINHGPLLKSAPFQLQSSGDLAGRGYFAGDRDHMIVCAGVDGDIHIWDRESGAPVERIQARAAGSGGTRSMAWSPWSSDSLTFVTAGRNVLKVWSILRPIPAPGRSPSHGVQVLIRKDVENNQLADQYTS
ncbi:hypothetical protein Hypma_016557 [Hypsizygus marmoreus]|uniref:WD40 repeat-like protein n=1 Tax=Hypsizygus marmoreus TaxID=39966 RepID=A0A369J1T1_HYPMA|nr:hypothetical protein Hypma_016557 [Hypsizygus marmoreus]